MDADPSVLGRQDDMLPRVYQNIKDRIQMWPTILLNVVAQRLTLNGKFLMSGRTVEKHMIIEATCVCKLKEAGT